MKAGLFIYFLGGGFVALGGGVPLDFHAISQDKSSNLHPLDTSFCVTWIAALLARCTAAQSSMRNCLRGDPEKRSKAFENHGQLPKHKLFYR